MKSSFPKLEARTILLRSGTKSKIVSLISLLLQTVFLFSIIFCFYSLFQIKYSFEFNNLNYRALSFYTVFIAGMVLSYCFICLLKFNEKRWYLNSSKQTPTIGSFFTPEKISTQIKIVYLTTLRYVFNLCYLIFYLLPATAVLFSVLNKLENTGISTLIFIFCSILFSVFLFTGIFFWFVSIQQYAFLNEIIFKNKSMNITEIINTSKKKTSGMCFTLAKFKFSFVLWYALSLLVLPLIFVLPYYNQSFACIASRKLAKKNQAQKKEEHKPVILMRLASETK